MSCDAQLAQAIRTRHTPQRKPCTLQLHNLCASTVVVDRVRVSNKFQDTRVLRVLKAFPGHRFDYEFLSYVSQETRKPRAPLETVAVFGHFRQILSDFGRLSHPIP